MSLFKEDDIFSTKNYHKFGIAGRGFYPGFKIRKVKSPAIPRPWGGGGGAVGTSDWCINRTYLKFHAIVCVAYIDIE